MDLLALLRKETITVRRNLALFLVVFVLLPSSLVAGTLVFERTIPQDVPVGVVPTDEATEADVAIARGGITSLSTPIEYDSTEAATRALEREEIYLIIEVPGNLADTDADATVTVTSDRAYVPLEEPIEESVGVIESQLDGTLPADVTVEHERIGTERTLSAFLVPTVVFVFVTLYALVYVPYQVRSERRVIERLRTETRLETVLASKLLFYGLSLLVSLLVVAAGSAVLGYDLAVLSPIAIAAVGLTYLSLAAVGLAILFVTNLEQSALFVDLALAFGIFALSSLLFPAGFFSTTERTISQALPTYYAAVMTRSGMLREPSVGVYAEYLLILAVTAVGSLLVLGAASCWYQRRR